MNLTSAALESQLEKVRSLESRLTFRMSTVSKMLDHQATELLQDTPLTLTSYRIMNIVDTFDRISISDISRFCGIDRAQTSRTAVDLEKQGYVQFGNDPTSKRKKLVSLTPEGLDLLNTLRPPFIDRNRQMAEAIGEDTYAAMIDGLNKLAIYLGR